jgi:putative exporter of polyketide antibiotics
VGFICFNVENQKPVGRGVFEKKETQVARERKRSEAPKFGRKLNKTSSSKK